MALQVNVAVQDNIHVARLGGRLDSITSAGLEKTLLDLLDSKAPCSLLLDCAGLEYVSSAGLRVMLIAAKRAKATKGRLVLCAMRAPVHEVFEISGFVKILDVQPDEAAGLAKLASG